MAERYVPKDVQVSKKQTTLLNLRRGVSSVAALGLFIAPVVACDPDQGQRGGDGGDMGVGSNGGIVPGANNQDCWKRTGVYKDSASGVTAEAQSNRQCGIPASDATCEPTGYVVIGNGRTNPSAPLIDCKPAERTYG